MTSREGDAKPVTPRTDVTSKRAWEREFCWRGRQIKPVGLVEESVKPAPGLILALPLKVGRARAGNLPQARGRAP